MAGPKARPVVGRRVLLVDDHAAFRESASAWLTQEGQVVVGACATGEEVLPACHRLRPDLVLLDLNLPGTSGLEVAEALAATGHPPAVVIISSDAEAGADPGLRAAPVAGFVAKRDLSWPAVDALLA